jgi:hypothetical protein
MFILYRLRCSNKVKEVVNHFMLSYTPGIDIILFHSGISVFDNDHPEISVWNFTFWGVFNNQRLA